MDSALQHIPLQARADALNALLGASRLQVGRGGARAGQWWSRDEAWEGLQWGGVGCRGGREKIRVEQGGFKAIRVGQ